MKWRRWLIVGVSVAALAVAVDLTPATTVGVACGEDVINVRGRFVDEDTGEPVVGAAVRIFMSTSRALDAYAGHVGERFEPRGSTAEDGTFLLTASRLAGWTIEDSKRSPPHYYGAEALAVERDGYGRHVVDCTIGTWAHHEGTAWPAPSATLDLGEIRIPREPAR